MSETHYEVRQYDPDGDDRRGESYHEGFYRSKEKAQEKADRYNESEIERHNAKCKAYWKKRQRSFDVSLLQYSDMRRLYDLGLSNTEPVQPVWHVAFNEWREYSEWIELPLPTTYYPEEYRAAEKPITEHYQTRGPDGWCSWYKPIPWDDYRLASNRVQPDHMYVAEIDYEDDE